MEEDPSDRAIARFARAEEPSHRSAATRPRPRCGSWSPAWVWRPTASTGRSRVLSGGERRRVELARILFAGSDVLLLDEPTNHLDSDAKNWLMGFLRAYRGALLVVSHDLDLLDEAITRVLHLDEAQLVEYKGTYSQYREARAADEMRLAKLAARQQAEIKRLSSLADSMRHQTAKRARIAKSLDKRVSRLQAAASSGPGKGTGATGSGFPSRPTPAVWCWRPPGWPRPTAGRPSSRTSSFAVERGERLLIMGLNGAGKTSLLRILAGWSGPDRRDVAHRGGRLGRLLRPGARGHPGRRERPGPPAGRVGRLRTRLRALLGMFGLVGDMAFQDAGTLSGGEKTKLALAQLVAGRHNLLLLDEPTNNLDPPSREAIGQALSSWPGAMILVSHDTGFVSQLAPDRVLLMPDGTEDPWSDDLLDLVAMA